MNCNHKDTERFTSGSVEYCQKCWSRVAPPKEPPLSTEEVRNERRERALRAYETRKNREEQLARQGWRRLGKVN